MGLVCFTFTFILLAITASFPLFIPSRTLVARFLLLRLLLLGISLVTRRLTSGFPGKSPTVYCHVRRAMTDLAAGRGFNVGGGDVVVSKESALSLRLS